MLAIADFEVFLIWIAIAAIVIFFGFIFFLASRYRRCPSDSILVVYGKIRGDQSAKCIHGGGTFVWPLIQDYEYLSLTPLTILIPLQNALSMQNIRIDVPSTFTVGISTDPMIMNNAAERLLRLSARDIEEMAKEIIFGQLRLTVASLTIEQINQDRESFLESIRKNVEPELNKIGLYLINVNITDITDESTYIESIGKKAASEAINKAKVDVAEQVKLGDIGESEANRERTVRVAENVAQAVKGKKQAEADQRIYVQQQDAAAVKGEKEAVANQRIFVQQQEADAVKGEKEAVANQRIFVQQQEAAAVKGEKEAEADRRVYVQQQEAEAVAGENTAKADIAKVDAELAIKEAEAHKRGEVAKHEAEVLIQQAQAKAETERLTADEVVKEQIDKRKIEISAEAFAEKLRREAKGQADAILAKYQAEAEGIRKVLDSKAAGYQSLVESCNGDAKSVATLLLIEKIEEIVGKQVEAIKNLKIDKITVWDSGSGADGTGTSTTNFLSNMIKAVPPLHDLAGMAGVELPDYLGRIKEQSDKPKPPAT